MTLSSASAISSAVLMSPSNADTIRRHHSEVIHGRTLWHLLCIIWLALGNMHTIVAGLKTVYSTVFVVTCGATIDQQ